MEHLHPKHPGIGAPTALLALEGEDGPEAGGFLLFLPSGRTKVVAWRAVQRISPVRPAAERYATEVVEALLRQGAEDDIRRTNWTSVAAAITRVIADWNARLEAAIASEHYFTAADGVNGPLWRDGSENMLDPASPLNLLTFCVLTLRNGFTVTGQSACASPENFSAEIGRKVARADAIRQVWPLLGYALRDRLHGMADRIAAAEAIQQAGGIDAIYAAR